MRLLEQEFKVLRILRIAVLRNPGRADGEFVEAQHVQNTLIQFK